MSNYECTLHAQMEWCPCVILAFSRLSQEDHTLEPSLEYIGIRLHPENKIK